MARSYRNTKKRTFTHLNAFDRGKIQVLWKQGKSLQAIANEIGCHKSTISRELKRGRVTQRRSDLTEHTVYFPDTGQAVYEKNRSHCGAKYKLAQASEFIQFAVEKMQKDHWSPDAICGYAKAQKRFENAMVCTKTLYHYIDLGLLPVKNIDLPLKVTRNTKQKRIRQHKKVLGTSIEQRPPHIDERKEFGHWEIDTVLGSRKQGAALLTLTERKTRKEHMIKIDQKTADSVKKAMQALKNIYGSTFSSVFKTITSDNGSEFSELSHAINPAQVEVYYTHPYTSSERGTNERHNGLIRRFIPKGKSIDDIDESLIAYVENWCNTLPRKILGYRSPNDLYHEELKSVV
ncbi:IS30 family transposase [Aneurinibacillus terranovensis]|uniref:IS30 family transposase n=2 Tax=Aneurinibacillus terranovensis TaxID=278991 RepID=UPI0004025FD1|nr:IS30 family transposase [Aneurinibacillus terranovensis]